MAGRLPWRQRIDRRKRDTYARDLAAKDPQTPWPARLVVAGVVAYAFSPLDLVPDFMPILGLLDALLLVPLGVLLASKRLPPGVLAESRAAAAQRLATGKPIHRSNDENRGRAAHPVKITVGYGRRSSSNRHTGALHSV